MAGIIIMATLVMLYRLHSQFESVLENSIETVQRQFSSEDLLKTPSDSSVVFSRIEELADAFQEHGFVDRLTITKVFGNVERPVYPFHLPALLHGAAKQDVPPALLQAIPQAGQPGVRTAELKVQQLTLGHIHIRLNTAPLVTVRIVIGGLCLLLVGTMGVFLAQFRRQHRVITATTIELEQKTREMVRLERLALAGQLSSSVFHDIKKPVLNIKNELEELSSTPETPPSASRVEETKRRLQEQVTLFFGILREGNLERFIRAKDEDEYVDINDLLERSLQLVRYERGNIEILRQLDPALPLAFASPVKLVQAFSNLILNACQAMEGHGTLTIISRVQQDQRSVIVEIADTGPGIPQQCREHIFAPFYSTKPPDVGTGLGLYIVREIVQECGGQITYESSSSGTCFRLVLPLPRS